MRISNRKPKEVLIATGFIRTILDDGTIIVSGPSAKLVGLPEGSLKIYGPSRLLGKRKINLSRNPVVKSIIYTRPHQKVTTHKNQRRR